MTTRRRTLVVVLAMVTCAGMVGSMAVARDARDARGGDGGDGDAVETSGGWRCRTAERVGG